MRVLIIGCAPSAKDWFNTPHDLSIGVNDCYKWGKSPDWLVLINRKFDPDREKVVKSTPAKKVFTHLQYWTGQFTKTAEMIRMQPFGKHLKKGHVYSSKTSPFVALSMAFNAGATEIILFGVDLKTHPVIKDKLLNYELRQFERFCLELSKYGIKVWVSSSESALSKFLPTWTCGGEVNAPDCKSGIHQFESDHVLKNIS